MKWAEDFTEGSHHRKIRLEAYVSVVASLPRSRAKIYEVLFRYGPMTMTEVCQKLEHDGEKVSRNSHTRFTELCRQGVIAEVGERECSYSGRNCLIYAVTDATTPLPLVKDEPMVYISEDDVQNLRDLWMKGTEQEQAALVKAMRALNWGGFCQ